MKLASIWVVASPTKDSILPDICFEMDPLHFQWYVKGGDVDPDLAFFAEPLSAREEAKRRLDAIKTVIS